MCLVHSCLLKFLILKEREREREREMERERQRDRERERESKRERGREGERNVTETHFFKIHTITTTADACAPAQMLFALTV